MAYGARQLCSQGKQEGFFRLGKTPPFALAHHQHAQHPAVLDDRHTQETVKRVFPDFTGVDIGLV